MHILSKHKNESSFHEENHPNSSKRHCHSQLDLIAIHMYKHWKSWPKRESYDPKGNPVIATDRTKLKGTIQKWVYIAYIADSFISTRIRNFQI